MFTCVGRALQESVFVIILCELAVQSRGSFQSVFSRFLRVSLLCGRVSESDGRPQLGLVLRRCEPLARFKQHPAIISIGGRSLKWFAREYFAIT